MNPTQSARRFRLSDLPPEILLYVFHSVDFFADLKSLVLTASFLNNVWKARACSISDAILFKIIDCFGEAVKL